jgi:iron complex outermembrane receptor protein
MSRNCVKVVAGCLLLALLSGPAAPAARAQARPSPDLSRATLEELMDIQLTSASRKEQRVGAVPAAVYVITQEDIRRSGMTTLPDVLRLAPGVQVAQINSNKWAVSIRGFNGLYADRLLVLIDGRVVYNRLYSGVLWDAEQVPLDDVDRIEVIRGPGAAMWGTNAVNGVINIVMAPAAATPGLHLDAEVGTYDRGNGSVHYGGGLGAVRYRLYSQWTTRGDSRFAPGVAANDGAHALSGGGRLDWTSARNRFMLEGSGLTGQNRPLWIVPSPATQPTRSQIIGGTSDLTGGSLLGRWTWSNPNGASVELQSSFDTAHRLESVGEFRHQAVAADFQVHAAVGARHDLVAGFGHRRIDESLVGSYGISLHPPDGHESILSAFAQDDIALAKDRLTLNLAAKLEDDSGLGWATQPTARLMWTVKPGRQHAWAAISRALHTPSLQERGLQLDYLPVPVDGGLPIATTILGNPRLRTEAVVGFDAGYRLAAGPFEIDVASFFSRYSDVRTSEPGTPRIEARAEGPVVHVPVQFANLLRARATGVELSAQWDVTSAWQIRGGFTTFHLAPHPDPASRDEAMAVYDGDAPRLQWLVRSLLRIGATECDLLVAHAGALTNLAVPAYTRVDLRVERPLGRGVSAAIVGRNLSDRAHLEYAPSGILQIATEVPRSLSFQLRWRTR